MLESLRAAFSVLAFPTLFGAQMVYAFLAVGEGRNPAALLFPVSYASIALLEWIFTFERSWQSYWHDVIPDSLFLLLGNFFRELVKPWLGSAGFFVAALLAGGEATGIWPHAWPLWLQWALALVIAELGQYWAHRAGHEIEFFWRFHSLHHSPSQLYFLNAARFHPFDAIWLNACSVLPLLMLGASSEVLILVGTVSLCHGVFQHSNLTLRLGPLNHVFSMTELHRWHHSKVLEEANTNYGTNLIVWDTIFGTRFLPDRRPPADVGLHEPGGYPKGFVGPLIAPFQWRRLQADPTAAALSTRRVARWATGIVGVLLLVSVGSVLYLRGLATLPDPVFVVERDIEIEASPEVVWQVLVDFEAYPDWNPYALRVEGVAAPGELIALTIAQDNWEQPRTVHPKIVTVDPNRKLAWHGTALTTGFLETDHSFELTRIGPARTRLHHAEEFRGWLAQRMDDENRRHTGNAFRAMNEALRERAEAVGADASRAAVGRQSPAR